MQRDQRSYRTLWILTALEGFYAYIEYISLMKDNNWHVGLLTRIPAW